MSTRPMPQARRALPTVALLLSFSALWAALWFFHALHYWEDDAYIHLEFARSLTRGLGFSFNGQIVYGDTSPLWVYLLIGMHALIADWFKAGKVLAACGVVFAGAGAYFLSYRLTANRVFAATMVAVFVLNPFFAYWSFSGMETITAAGAALWGAYFISDRETTASSFLGGCLIVGVGPILRPEMAFFSAILAVIVLVRFSRMGAAFRRKLALFVPGLLLAAGPTLVWSLYALRTFGLLVPNTNAAKRALPHDSVTTRLVNLYAISFPLLLLGAVALAVYLIYRRVRKAGTASAPVLRIPVAGWVFLIWTCITSVFYVLNHTYVQTRYVFVSASGFVVIALAIIYLNFPRLWRPAALLTAVPALLVSLVATWPLVQAKAELDEDTVTISQWIKENLPANDPIAMYAIGEIVFRSGHGVIDTGGITRPGVIPYMGNGPATVEWARHEGAVYYVAPAPPVPGAVQVYGMVLPDTTWNLNPYHVKRLQIYNIWRFPGAGTSVAPDR